MNKITAVIIDRDKPARDSLVEFIKRMDVVVLGAVADYTAGFELVERTRPDILIVDLHPANEHGFEFVGRVSRNAPSVFILGISSDGSSESILKTIKSGCSDFLMKPVDGRDLADSVSKACRMRVNAPHNNEAGSIIACLSAKGGSGNTTIAVSLAFAIAKITGKSTAIADMDLTGGSGGAFMDMDPKYTIYDAAINSGRLDRSFMQGVLARHKSGITFLAPPGRPEQAGAIGPDTVRDVAVIMGGMFNVTVIDAGKGLTDKNAPLLEAADIVVLTGIISLPSIINMKKIVDSLKVIGIGTGKLKTVLNRYDKKGDIPVRDAEKTIGAKFSWRVPNSYIEAEASINRGVPLIELFPESEAGRSLAGFARQVSQEIISSKGRTAHAGQTEVYAA
ncbi:MAG TPA: response regulator [Nitrospirota bacterium]